MNNKHKNVMKYTNIYTNAKEGAVYDSKMRDYMFLIYKNMSIALFLSAIVAFIVGNSQFLMRMFFSNPLISLIVQLAPLFFVFNFTRAISRISVEEARGKLFIFAGLMGISLSTVFMIYTRQSITETFLTTSITFGGMSLYGYTTKKDLTSMGSYLIMCVTGLFVASLINLFIRSSSMSYGLSCISVVIFTLYTAYDVQKLKNSYYFTTSSDEVREKVAIFGALELYMDFVNLFLTLLRLLNRGDRRGGD
jgi:FtsH-binding integral membrane protein